MGMTIAEKILARKAGLASVVPGQIVDAYRDISVSGTNDPGGRVIEFMLRFVF